MINTEFATPILYKTLPLIITLSFFVIYLLNNENNYKNKSILNIYIFNIKYILSNNIYSYFNQRLFIELFYNKFISGLILNLGSHTTKIIDKGSIEYIGPYGLEIGLLNISNKLSKLDSGVITSYALFILSGLIIYLFIWNNIITNELIIIILINIYFITTKIGKI